MSAPCFGPLLCSLRFKLPSIRPFNRPNYAPKPKELCGKRTTAFPPVVVSQGFSFLLSFWLRLCWPVEEGQSSNKSTHIRKKREHMLGGPSKTKCILNEDVCARTAHITCSLTQRKKKHREDRNTGSKDERANERAKGVRGGGGEGLFTTGRPTMVTYHRFILSLPCQPILAIPCSTTGRSARWWPKWWSKWFWSQVFIKKIFIGSLKRKIFGSIHCICMTDVNS